MDSLEAGDTAVGAAKEIEAKQSTDKINLIMLKSRLCVKVFMKTISALKNLRSSLSGYFLISILRRFFKSVQPPTCDLNRDSGTGSTNDGWLGHWFRHHIF
jgi:hypothetical protein